MDLLEEVFFQCCTTAPMNTTLNFGIKHSQIMMWWLSAKTCKFSRSSWLYLLWTPWGFVQRAFESKTDFCNRLSRSMLDMCACVSEKKGLASRILSLITLSIIGGQKRNVSSHVHILSCKKASLFEFCRACWFVNTYDV